ncbi:MAG: DUF624 domain-containing protein [Clostridia bacterium]|nr:DUF624 domain-containing protein [Clostridia bacterium]
MSKYDERPRLDDLEEKPVKKKKKFNIFDILYGKDKVEDDPGDRDAPRNFAFFFKLTGRNMRRLFSLNLLLVFANFPIFLVLLATSQNLHDTALAPASALAAPLYGASYFGAASPASAAMFGLHGVTTPVAYWTPLALTVLIVGLVLLLFTFGLSVIGVTYIMRNIVRGEMVFMWQDFIYAIKRNLKQGLILGFLDFLFTFLLCYDIYFFYLNFGGGTWSVVGFWASLVIFFFYFIMRFYTYLQALTFDLTIKKIFKNSLIFAILGMKRNLMALLGMICVLILNLMILQVLTPVGILLPLLITVALMTFMANYAAWPVVKRFMIDPYEKARSAEEEEDEEDGDAEADPA